MSGLSDRYPDILFFVQTTEARWFWSWVPKRRVAFEASILLLTFNHLPPNLSKLQYSDERPAWISTCPLDGSICSTSSASPVAGVLPGAPQSGSVRSSDGFLISSRYKTWGASTTGELSLSGSWHWKLNIALPWLEAAAEILLERNQNPNRNGKSLVSKAYGIWFLFVFILELYFSFLLLAHFLLSVLSLSPKSHALKWVLLLQLRKASESDK